jgi:hypothetical protein
MSNRKPSGVRSVQARPPASSAWRARRGDAQRVRDGKSGARARQARAGRCRAWSISAQSGWLRWCSRVATPRPVGPAPTMSTPTWCARGAASAQTGQQRAATLAQQLRALLGTAGDAMAPGALPGGCGVWCVLPRSRSRLSRAARALPAQAQGMSHGTAHLTVRHVSRHGMAAWLPQCWLRCYSCHRRTSVPASCSHGAGPRARAGGRAGVWSTTRMRVLSGVPATAKLRHLCVHSLVWVLPPPRARASPASIVLFYFNQNVVLCMRLCAYRRPSPHRRRRRRTERPEGDLPPDDD